MEMLRDTRIGCISTRRVLPEERLGDEMSGSGDEGGEGGTGPPNVISFLPFGMEGIGLFLLFTFLCWAD